jgi:hypothetical protein
VKRILDLGFVDQNSRDLGGLSAAENGAVVFCRKLSSGLEAQLKARGFQIDTRFGDLTSINLAKVTPEELREKVVMPAVRASGVADEVWSSSVGENHQAINFQRLMQMSRHESAQRTHDACQRFGTAYVKVNDTQDGKGQSLVRNLGDYAAAAGVLCLVTPPLENHPIWTVDLGAGVTKSDAMRSISEVYSVLTGLSESKIRFLYFGDGENDLPAFEYMSTRAGEHNFAFLLDNPHGNNDERAMRVAPGTRYLRGYYDLAGVRFGIKQVCGI